MKDSIALINEWDEAPSSDDWVERLPNLGDEQLQSLLQHLADGYWAWEDDWAKKKEPNLDFLVFGHPVGESEKARARWTTQAKSTALCFDNASVSDPLAAKLWPQITLAQMGIGSFDAIRKTLRERLPQILSVKPLLDSQDLKLMPDVFLSDTEHVQKVARLEIFGESQYIDIGDGMITSSPGHTALLSALCAEFDVSPIATTKYYQKILYNGIESFRSNVDLKKLELEDAICSFDLPNLSQLPAHEISVLRRNSDALENIRTDLTSIYATARARAGTLENLSTRDLFEEAFVDGLRKRQERLQSELSKSDVLQSFVVPGAVSIGIGLVSYMFDHTVISDPEKIVQLLTGVAGPGATWLLYTLLKRLETDRRTHSAMDHFYGHLIVDNTG